MKLRVRFFALLSDGTTITRDVTEIAGINLGLSGFNPSRFLQESPEPSTLTLASTLGAAGLAGAWRRGRSLRAK